MHSPPQDPEDRLDLRPLHVVLLVIPPVRELDFVGIVDVFAAANGVFAIRAPLQERDWKRSYRPVASTARMS